MQLRGVYCTRQYMHGCSTLKVHAEATHATSRCQMSPHVEPLVHRVAKGAAPDASSRAGQLAAISCRIGERRKPAG
jgi:hypothetical protein